MYRCELIEDGIVKERFFRCGDSTAEVQEGLEIFQWGGGEWRITDTDDAE